jgi:hypothetical protein
VKNSLKEENDDGGVELKLQRHRAHPLVLPLHRTTNVEPQSTILPARRPTVPEKSIRQFEWERRGTSFPYVPSPLRMLISSLYR